MMKFASAIFLMFLAAALAPFASALPDLNVSVSLSEYGPHVGDTLFVWVMTANGGNGSANASHTISYEGPSGFPHIFSVPALPAGAQQMDNYTFTCPYQGTFHFNASADAWNEVAESNEDNNFGIDSVYCSSANATPSPQPLPNLITNIGFSDNNPIIGQNVTVYVNTTNYGAGQSGPSHTLSSVNTEWAPHLFAVPSLSPWGGSHMNTYWFTCPFQGWFYFNASADAWYEVDESDENDNAAQASLYCLGTPTPTPFPVPVISGVYAANITATTAKVYWLTDVSSDSRVEYGLASGNYSNAAGSQANTTYHLIALSGLVPNSKYYYRVKSCAPAGNCAYSGEYSFKTKLFAQPDRQLGLVIALQSSLAEELAQLPADSAERGLISSAAGSIDASSPNAAGRLQGLRAIVRDTKDAINRNKLATSLAFGLAAAMATGWFFYDRRKAKIRSRARNRK